MGDRTIWREDCPKCGGKGTVEVYDAPSCIQWSCMCDKCGWNDGRDYYETEPNTIELLTEQQAKDRKKWKRNVPEKNIEKEKKKWTQYNISKQKIKNLGN